MKHAKYPVLFCLATIFAQLNAQGKHSLTLEEALATAEKNNENVKIAELEQNIAHAEYKQTDAIFLPSVSLNYSAMLTNNPLNAFGFLLQQSGVSAASFDPAKLNHPSATRNFATGIEAKMPLLNLDLTHARKAAKLQEEVYRFRKQYTADFVAFEIKKAYTQLQFAYKMKEILAKTKEDVGQIYQSVTNFYEQGLLQKSDVLNAQVQVNTVESSLVKAESSIANASEALQLLMGVPTDSPMIYLADSLKQENVTMVLPPYGFSEQRADVAALSKAVEASQSMLKSARMRLFPKINAFANYQFNSKNVFGFKNDSYLMGIHLSWTIFSGKENRSKIATATLQQNKLQEELQLHKEKSRLEIDKTLRDLIDLQAEMKVRENSVASSEEALRIMNNRHKEGLVSTTDLLQSQAQLSQQQLQQAQTVMNYNIAVHYYTFLTTINE